MHTVQNLHTMQNSLLLKERTSALLAVYGYFYTLTQVLSATLEWSVISMLKHFVFVAIVLSAFITGIVEWSGCLEKADRKEKQVEAQERAKIEEPQVKEQSEAQVPMHWRK